jgi:RNA polymerase sigma factor (TIGR02999 family)
MQQPHDVTQLLQAWQDGDSAALESLIPIVYDELHRLAHCCMVRERAKDTLQTTALVHEAYLRLVAAQQVEWKDRVHFFAISAGLMRRILVDFARGRTRQKRGGEARKVALDESAVVSPEPGEDLVALDDALQVLAAIEPRQARVIELRFFGGMTGEEIADLLEISSDTVLRDWKKAKLWLWRELKHGKRNETGTLAAN